MLRQVLSEEGSLNGKAKLADRQSKVIGRGEGTALCTHGPVLPEILTTLARHTPKGRELTMLTRLTRSNLDKGEVLAVHLAGTGARATVLHLERHRPPS